MKPSKYDPLIEGVDFYIDPETGWDVWTREYLLNRGYCCHGDCRHCPYGDAGIETPQITIIYEGETPGCKPGGDGVK